MRGVIWGLVLMLGATGWGQGAGSPARPKVVLVELFTSEGCSDCPPADALLRQVNGTRTSAGQMIVGISEHVTYWNSLGWTDPFSAAEFTERQNGYGGRFRLESVYTPQMVVNGAHQFVGSSRGDLEQAIREEQDQTQTVDVRIVAASVEGDSLRVSFSVDSLAGGDAALKGAELVAVLADDVDQSSVLRGENSGRRLTHVAVARALVRVGSLKVGEGQVVKVALPASFRAGAGHHLILFAQGAGLGRVLGADSRAL